MDIITIHPNPDLVVGAGDKPRWNLPDHRRHGFHNLHRIIRYGHHFRAARVMRLEKELDTAIAMREDVQRMTALPWFSAMIVVRGSKILYEKRAADFGFHQPHTIMSISKLSMNLIIGSMVDSGKIDPNARVDRYLPWISDGYAGATVQEVLNMDVVNNYIEDYSDPSCTSYEHEAATGFRLPREGGAEGTTKSFIASIGLAEGCRDTKNRSRLATYKSANTDVLGFIAESVSGRPMISFLADLADAAGFEDNLHVACDRVGYAMPDGGFSLTIRDLARFGSLFARRGRGVDGQPFGSEMFIERTLASGVPFAADDPRIRYSNSAYTDGRWIGHGGWGGQFLLVDLRTGTVCAFLSVLEDRDAYVEEYYTAVIRMLEDIAAK